MRFDLHVLGDLSHPAPDRFLFAVQVFELLQDVIGDAKTGGPPGFLDQFDFFVTLHECSVLFHLLIDVIPLLNVHSTAP
jgi:hypothetical protein